MPVVGREAARRILKGLYADEDGEADNALIPEWDEDGSEEGEQEEKQEEKQEENADAGDRKPGPEQSNNEKAANNQDTSIHEEAKTDAGDQAAEEATQSVSPENKG